ncbi:hypothetical protein C0J52_10643 [Blattella germanica]|nr:hypothetical protein C0J52_10643 [Blattella germanica]
MPGPRKNKKNRNKHHGGGAPERRGDVNIVQDATKVDGEAEQPTEKDSGVPYIIKSCDVKGRYLVASRDIRQGELILTADPLVVGPPQGCQPMCLGCYKKLELEDNPYRCNGCGWPMCSKGCSGKGKEYGHSEAECRLYESARSKLVSMKDTLLTSLYLVVVPLRCLLLETTNPEKYRILLTMEAHNDLRRNLPCIWKINQENVVDRIRQELGFTQFEEEMIHTVCGFLEVNAFEVGQNDISIRALYPHAFYLAHDCVPNTGHTDDKNFTLRIRATIPIPKGDSINLSYAYTLQHLKESKFFDCKCARCSDPTELGTYAGALKCPKCNGPVLSTQPLDNSAEWRCNNGA